MSLLNLDEIRRRPIDIATKGVPLASIGQPIGSLGTLGAGLFDGTVPFPAAVLRNDVLEHNLGTMALFTQALSLRLAPHGKTSMSPELFERQLQAGAWGMTAATVTHVALYRHVDVQRIILANQVAEQGSASALVRMMEDAPFELLCIVDSIEAATLLSDACAASPKAVQIDVLIEIGMPGGRTGLRRASDAIALGALIVATMPQLRLRGIEAFEGLVSYDEQSRQRVDALLDQVTEAATALRKVLTHPDPIVSVGGSAYYPLVAERLLAVQADYAVTLRSGCYITHDHGLYELGRTVEACQGTSVTAAPLRPALEVWTLVQSLPESGLALLTGGKRDLSHDAGLPVPIKRVGNGETRPTDLPTGFSITALNDQHAYLRYPERYPLALGDRIGLGCSHPCTTFDKWKVLLLVNEDYAIVDAVGTFF